jgi:hypothetical protein
MRFQLQRRLKPGPYVELEDPAFRSRCISLASTGSSRRTVAALVGKPESTMRGWINRGIAYPQEEPYASFAVDYQRAERGIANAIDETAAMKVQLLREQMRARLEWGNRPPPPTRPVAPAKLGRKATDEERAAFKVACAEHDDAMMHWELAMEAWKTPPPSPQVDDMMWMERHKVARFPVDYGTSKHRLSEADYSADEHLEQHALTHEQMRALFRDPPPAIDDALLAEADVVYARLLARGFEPGKKGKT